MAWATFPKMLGCLTQRGWGRIYISRSRITSYNVCYTKLLRMLGLTLGPVTGEIVASHVLGRDDPRIEGLAPARFA